MHIIVVGDHQSAPRSFTLGPVQLAGAMFVLVAGLLSLACTGALLLKPALSGVNLAARAAIPVVADVGPTINMMTLKLGEMEAQLLRLDAFSDRMSHLIVPRGLAAARPANAAPASAPAALPGDAPTARAPGAPASGTPPAVSESAGPHAGAETIDALRVKLAQVASAIEERAGRLNRLESAMVDLRAEARTLPTTAPILQGSHSSNYGERSDPINGEASFHPGIDFVAPVGTVFAAAATGVVISARPVPEYGNMIEIDHGNGLTTRYAHASRLDVHEGDLVLKGQPIGLVGTTGRSTGPHLHFEVRDHGQTLNPEKFLRLAS